MIAHIHIFSSSHKPISPKYLIGRLASEWSQSGIKITYGPAPELDADIGIVHVDQTKIPKSFLPDNPRNRPLLNASVLDISKTCISRNLLTRDSIYEGQVIIKTDDNAFGGPERRRLSQFNPKRFLRSGIFPKRFWRFFRELPHNTYPVLGSLSDVPDWVWSRNDLVVEKFLPEMEGEDYVLRVWLFFGDREYGAKLIGREPVVKVKSLIRYEYTDEVPESLRKLRAELGMDFGKFDYVISNNEAVLLDVNKTPTIATTVAGRTSRSAGLASGLNFYVKA